MWPRFTHVCLCCVFSLLGLSHYMIDLLKCFGPSLCQRAISYLCPSQASSLCSGPATVLSVRPSRDYCQMAKQFGETIVQVSLFPAQVGLRMKISQYFCLLCKVIFLSQFWRVLVTVHYTHDYRVSRFHLSSHILNMKWWTESQYWVISKS
jgi:hypothetical protein